jgi:hypothetical protein
MTEIHIKDKKFVLLQQMTKNMGDKVATIDIGAVFTCQEHSPIRTIFMSDGGWGNEFEVPYEKITDEKWFLEIPDINIGTEPLIAFYKKLGWGVSFDYPSTHYNSFEDKIAVKYDLHLHRPHFIMYDLALATEEEAKIYNKFMKDFDSVIKKRFFENK